MIVFCGVHFMAEPRILNPTKRVLLPDLRAGQPLADAVTGQALADRKGPSPRHPDLTVVGYVNATAR